MAKNEELKKVVKRRCGITDEVTIYDEDIEMYIDDSLDDMKASGVPSGLIKRAPPGVITAVSHYVRAHIGDDRSDTNRYLGMYRQKVSRLILEEDSEESDDVE